MMTTMIIRVSMKYEWKDDNDSNNNDGNNDK